MYNEFFGLKTDAFNLTPDPEFLYLSKQHREALAGLAYGLLARKGFVLVTGEAGTGKTTLLRRVLGSLPSGRIQFSVILNPTLTPSEFLESAMIDFGLRETQTSKAQRLTTLQNFLWEGHREGKISALVVDEAHKLSPELLEEIRLLGNFESTKEKLLQIVLVGQKEIEDVLNTEQLRPLKQRLALRLSLEPLAAAETEQYIGHRWLKAGGAAVPFTAEAIARIGQASQGTPRVINVICDNALLQAYGEQAAQVEARHVSTVCRELRLIKPVAQNGIAGGTVLTPPKMPADQGLLVSGTGELPAIAELPAMKTLERYNTRVGRRSLLSRVAGKLGFVQRIETA